MWLDIDSSWQTSDSKWLDRFCDSTLTRPSHDSTLTRKKFRWLWLDKYDSSTSLLSSELKCGSRTGFQTCGQRAACGPRGPFVRPAILFGNFLIINISIAKCLEKTCHEIIEPKLNDTQCGLRPGRSTTDQIFPLQQIFEKSWEYAKDIFTCFVDLEKAYNRVPFQVTSLHKWKKQGINHKFLIGNRFHVTLRIVSPIICKQC